MGLGGVGACVRVRVRACVQMACACAPRAHDGLERVARLVVIEARVNVRAKVLVDFAAERLDDFFLERIEALLAVVRRELGNVGVLRMLRKDDRLAQEGRGG